MTIVSIQSNKLSYIVTTILSTGILNQTIVEKSTGLMASRNEIQETLDIGNAIGENINSEIGLFLSNPTISMSARKLVGNG